MDSHKTSHQLASEALEALDHFILALNEFFDLCNELTEMIMQDKMIIVEWYNSATISSRDIIHARSQYYHHAQFDNVSINMNAEEMDQYSTDNRACFAKV